MRNKLLVETAYFKRWMVLFSHHIPIDSRRPVEEDSERGSRAGTLKTDEGLPVSTNGSNPRLDRIERIIEQSELANKRAHARFESELRKSAEKTADEHRKIADEHRKITVQLRRWATLGVKRNQRRKHRVLDARLKKMDAESKEYRRRTDQNLAEITDRLTGLIGFVAGR